MENKLISNLLIFGLVCLFIISSFIPIVTSYNQTSEKDEYLENLAYICRDENGASNFNFYKELLFKERCEDEVEKDKLTDTPSIYSNLLNPSLNSPWPMFGHDSQHSGRSPYSTENNNGIELWNFRVDFGIEGSPVIDEKENIYFGSSDDYLHSLYPNGTEKWHFDCGDWVTSTPAIAIDGTIYVTSWNCILYSVYSNGTEKWRFHTSGSLRSSPIISDDGIIYFGVLGPESDSGRIYALYPNGTEKWHFDTNAWIYMSPAIGIDGTIYITSNDNHLYALYPDNGTMIWKFKMGDWPGSPSIADDGTIYVSSWDGYLYSINQNGTLRWKHGIDYGGANTPAVSQEGIIYIGMKFLYAVYPNGTRKWTYDCGGDFEITTSAAISSDGAIFVGATEGTYRGDLIAINPDGSTKWRKEGIANDWIMSSPAIGCSGTVYIGSTSAEGGWPYGTLYAFGEPDQNAPEAPTIRGETDGTAGKEYEYTFCSIDPNSDDVYYYIDWGDGEFEDWFGPYYSGEEVTVSHTWDEEGDYTIRARAKDTDNHWSPWGELEVSMPVNQQTVQDHPLLSRFLEQFPNAFQNLRKPSYL